jgi:WD40 repeat protein
LTPYRVVTTGSDGFARVWDIREACLKRYGALIGKRQEYRLRLTASEKKAESEDRSDRRERTQSETLLPPLPAREGSVAPSAGALSSVSYAANSQQSNNSPSAPSPGRVIVPPLPVGVPPLPGADANLPEQNAGGGPVPNGGENDNIAPGQFIANDLMDEGVKLLSKHKHGTTGEDLAGPGTRSRRAAVNVICVSRCPLGGHFTTGSDDGICRVWEDGEDDGVAIVDRRAGGMFSLDEVSGLSQRRLRSVSSGT